MVEFGTVRCDSEDGVGFMGEASETIRPFASERLRMIDQANQMQKLAVLVQCALFAQSQRFPKSMSRTVQLGSTFARGRSTSGASTNHAE